MNPCFNSYTKGDFTNDLDINLLGFYTGILSSADFVRKTDAMVSAKKSNNVKISHGQAIASLILYMLRGSYYHGLHGISSFAKTTPVAAMLNIPDHTVINRDVVAAALDAIAEIGPSDFTMQASSWFLPVDQIRVAHIDTTSVHFHGTSKVEESTDPEMSSGLNGQSGAQRETECEERVSQYRFINDREGIALAKGYSRDGHPELPQVNVIMASARLQGFNTAMPIWSSCFSGFQNDIDRYKKFAQEELGHLQTCFGNLSCIVTDSAGACAETILAVKSLGLTMLTRLPDGRKEAREAFDMVRRDPSLLKTFSVRNDGDTADVQMAFVEDYTFTSADRGHKVQCRALMVRSESLCEQKSKLVRKRADAEKNRIEKELKKYNSKPAACLADAEKQIQQIIGKPQFCKISEPSFIEHKHYAKAGKPGKNAVPSSYSYTACMEVIIDEEMVREKIERELLYIILSSDMSLSETEIYNRYHGQVDIEQCWEEVKMPEFYVSSLYLKTPHRIRALMSVVHVALLVARIFMSTVRSALKKRSMCIRYPNGMKTDKPGLSMLTRLVSEAGIRLKLDSNGEFIITNVRPGTLIDILIQDIGPCCYDYFTPSFFNRSRESLLTQLRCDEHSQCPLLEDDLIICRIS